MKKCYIIKNLIQEYIDNTIDEVNKQKLLNHIKECKDCEQEFKDYFKIINSLKNIKETPLPNGFEERLHNKLINAYYQQEIFSSALRRLEVVFISFVFMLVIIGFFVFKNFRLVHLNYINFYPSDHTYALELSNYKGSNSVPIYENGTLRIKLKTDKEIKNVEVYIIIPSEISLEEKQKVIKWKGNLKPGENYLLLNVKGKTYGEFPINIKIKQNSKEKNLTTSLKVI